MYHEFWPRLCHRYCTAGARAASRLSLAVRRRHRVLRFLNLPRKVLNLESYQFDRNEEFRGFQLTSMKLAVKRTQTSEVLVQPLLGGGHGLILTDTSLASVLRNLVL